MEKKFFSSESVTEGHPDKLCDRISDSILDKIIESDPTARVACETCATTGLVMVMGEITTSAYVDIAETVRAAIADIGYNKPEYGFDAASCAVLNSIHEQSPDIAMGVDHCLEAKTGEQNDQYNTGAGDQGMVFGYACDETETLMPLGYVLATEMAKRLTKVRKDGVLSYLRPDGKTQVTVEYDGDTPVRLDNIVVSTQHDPDVTLDRIRADIIEHVIMPVVPENFMDAQTKIYVNPTGRFVIGGPQGDSGLTGRKIIVDTYLRRLRQTRRRRFFRQGPDQGRPQCELCREICREKYRRRRTCEKMRGADFLCNRRGKTAFGECQYVRHGKRCRRENCKDCLRHGGFTSGGNHRLF